MILIVDDDPVQVRLLQGRLSDLGYDVEACTEAADGLQRAIEQPPDLIILDVMMPIINGYNFCRLVKSEEMQRPVPVIFLTSRDDKDDRRIGKEMGAEAYFTKPVDMEALSAKIQDLLSG